MGASREAMGKLGNGLVIKTQAKLGALLAPATPAGEWLLRAAAAAAACIQDDGKRHRTQGQPLRRTARMVEGMVGGCRGGGAPERRDEGVPSPMATPLQVPLQAGCALWVAACKLPMQHRRLPRRPALVPAGVPASAQLDARQLGRAVWSIAASGTTVAAKWLVGEPAGEACAAEAPWSLCLCVAEELWGLAPASVGGGGIRPDCSAGRLPTSCPWIHAQVEAVAQLAAAAQQLPAEEAYCALAGAAQLGQHLPAKLLSRVSAVVCVLFSTAVIPPGPAAPPPPLHSLHPSLLATSPIPHLFALAFTRSTPFSTHPALPPCHPSPSHAPHPTLPCAGRSRAC
jgi:hypothetical protein